MNWPTRVYAAQAPGEPFALYGNAPINPIGVERVEVYLSRRDAFVRVYDANGFRKYSLKRLEAEAEWRLPYHAPCRLPERVAVDLPEGKSASHASVLNLDNGDLVMGVMEAHITWDAQRERASLKLLASLHWPVGNVDRALTQPDGAQYNAIEGIVVEPTYYGLKRLSVESY